MPSQNVRSKKITLLKSDHEDVLRIAAKKKMTKRQVVEKALRTALPLMPLLAQAVRARK
jgi:hypothetical protein